jgi:hypothetical protein
MSELIGGIFIGIGIETLCIISYIYYKKRKVKPSLPYDEVFNVNVDPDIDVQQHTNDGISISYDDL